MKNRFIAIVAGLVLSGGVAAACIQYEAHSHTAYNAPQLGHGGGLDSRGGHNCSAKSKSKGLCSGYHRHR